MVMLSNLGSINNLALYVYTGRLCNARGVDLNLGFKELGYLKDNDSDWKRITRFTDPELGEAMDSGSLRN